MHSADKEDCFKCCVGFLFAKGLLAVYIWVSLRVTSPTCSIENFYAFALNKSHISPPTPHTNDINHTLSYDLKLKNRNKDKGIYYDALNVTLYYYTGNNSFTIGNSSFVPFYQGHQKSTHRYGSFDPPGVDWESVSNVSQDGSNPIFTVELATAVRYKIVFWKTKRHRLVVKADLKVNDLGKLVRVKKNKGIKLSNGSPPLTRGSFGIFGNFLLAVFAFTHFW